MLIVCPSCATSYNVDAASLAPGGRRVRCVRCAEVWHAEVSQASRLMAAAEALAPVRRAVEALAEVGAASAPTVEAQAVREPESVAGDSAEPAPPRDDSGGSLEAQTELLEADRAGVGFRPAEIPQLDVPAPPIAPVDGAGAPSAALAGEPVLLDDDVDYAPGRVAPTWTKDLPRWRMSNTSRRDASGRLRASSDGAGRSR